MYNIIMQGFLIFSVFNLLNRILSFIRISIQAMFLGDGLLNDSFTLANRTLSLFRRIAVDGNLETMIVTYYKTNENKKQFAGKILSLLLIILIAISIFLSSCNNLIAKFWSVKSELLPSYKQFLTYMSPIIPMMFITSIFVGLLNANKRFVYSASATFIGNLFNLSAIIFLSQYVGIFWSLIIGSLLYSLIPVLFMLPFVIQYIEVPKTLMIDKDEQDFFKKSGSSAIWQNVTSLSDFYTHNQAAKLPIGSMSAFEYGHKIIFFVYSIIASSLSSVFSAKIAGEKKSIQQEQISEGFVITHILSITPCLFIILYGSMISDNVFGSMKLIKNLKLISDNFMVCGISLYFFIQVRILNTALLSNKHINLTIIGSMIFAVINFICSYFYCDSIFSLSWGCNLATICQFIFLFIINIYHNYIKLKLIHVIYLIISTISGYFMTIGVNYLYNLGMFKKLFKPIFDTFSLIKPLAGSFDILVPFFLFYVIHLAINYKFTKFLFQSNKK